MSHRESGFLERMKRLLVAAALAVMVAGCTSQTAVGPCVGAFDQRDPHLIYKLALFNVFIGILFLETIIVPLIVVADETLCPTEGVP